MEFMKFVINDHHWPILILNALYSAYIRQGPDQNDV